MPASFKQRKIALFGHFGRTNFGNESTLGAILYHLRRAAPDAEFNCICTGPETAAAAYNINATASRDYVVRPWRLNNPLARWVRKLLVGVPAEFGRWLKGFKTLWRTDAFIIPGTGLLTDAYTFFYWGPYDMFRWSVTAKLCRCKVLFVSVGAGPLYTRAGRLLVKAALSMAEFRSYRDEPSRQYLERIGVQVGNDPIYPDLAFSLPDAFVRRSQDSRQRRLVVGIGLMEYAWRYSVERPTKAIYSAYLEALAEFAKWLLAHEFDVRLLIGDLVDAPVKEEFRSVLKERSGTHEADRIMDEPVGSVEDLLTQLAATDLVVATRFHNVLLALLADKPVIAVSFHHKCASLMSQVGLGQYCHDINGLSADWLIQQFRQLCHNADSVKRMIRDKVNTNRRALDKQYEIIFDKSCLGRHPGMAATTESQTNPSSNFLL